MMLCLCVVLSCLHDSDRHVLQWDGKFDFVTDFSLLMDLAAAAESFYMQEHAAVRGIRV